MVQLSSLNSKSGSGTMLYCCKMAWEGDCTHIHPPKVCDSEARDHSVCPCDFPPINAGVFEPWRRPFV